MIKHPEYYHGYKDSEQFIDHSAFGEQHHRQPQHRVVVVYDEH